MSPETESHPGSHSQGHIHVLLCLWSFVPSVMPGVGRGSYSVGCWSGGQGRTGQEATLAGGCLTAWLSR